MAANHRSVPTAVAGANPNIRTRRGVISAPPPTPVMPTAAPTPNPAMVLARFSSIRRLYARLLEPTLQQCDDRIGCCVGSALDGVHDQIGRFRSLVRGVDAGESRQLAAPRLAIEALDVPGFRHRERSIDIDLQELVCADRSEER